ncbi:LPS export ABC transporter ATP-binding protein [Candidatus Sarmatiella mevalonica]|uniref:LPS export ABC transporter ATP-binding protein n=1 Tax=Candidatus Sarmatiella mevalonica TaxID=2770581 RepID=UPI003977AD0A
MIEDILQVHNICKSYYKIPTLHDVSMHIHRGEVVGLFGPNGAGKTTCFNIIAGLVRPSKGRVCINHTNITKLPIYLRAGLGIAYLPQESSIFVGLSVKDNIKAILQLHTNDERLIERDANKLLEQFQISHLALSKASNLSGGQRRRLEIARALATQPKFCMLDEPFAGVDPVSIQDVRQIIKYLKNANIGVLITDHNIRDTLPIVDRVYIIYEGRVLLEGDAQSIAHNPMVREVYLGNEFNY